MISRTQKNYTYRKRIIIASEGVRTEPEYFQLFNSPFQSITSLAKVGQGAPAQVLNQIKAAVDKTSLKAEDQVWIVIDRDDWPERDIDACAQWVAEKTSEKIIFGLALSNPKFEYWLLLHFDDGVGAETPRACDQRLREYVPHYDKHIRGVNWLEKVPMAIEHAMRNLDLNKPWPKQKGQTSVVLLVKELLKSI